VVALLLDDVEDDIVTNDVEEVPSPGELVVF
jgi:hypothetical protein